MKQIKNHSKDYIINRFTMAILPKENKDSAEVLEIDDEIIVSKRPTEIVVQSCLFYGSSYSGRKEGTKELIRTTHKPPIVLDPANNIYFFPTISSTNQKCIWLAYSHVKDFRKAAHNNTIVTFSNDKEITLPISVASFERQFSRTARLQTNIFTRIEHEQRKLNMLLFPKDEREINTIYEKIIMELRKRL